VLCRKTGAAVERIVRLASESVSHLGKSLALLSAHFEIGIDDVIDSRPLIPRKRPSEPDGCRGARETIRIPDEVFPARTELNFIEPAVTARQSASLEQQSAFEQVGVYRGEPP